MKTRQEIQNDGRPTDVLMLEILLDIRDLLKKQTKQKRKVPSSPKRV